ncbi:MAG: hypothetical protein WC878_06705 [Candidatus Paceibacterota bacterium]
MERKQQKEKLKENLPQQEEQTQEEATLPAVQNRDLPEKQGKTDEEEKKIRSIKEKLEILTKPSAYSSIKEVEACFEHGNLDEALSAINAFNRLKKSEERDPEKEAELRETKEKILRSQIESAREILGNDNILGPNDLGISMDLNDIPPFPSADEIEEAAKEGLMLVLLSDKMPDGRPLTLKNLIAEHEDDFRFSDTNFIDHQDAPFFTEETPRCRWIFVGRDYISGTEGKNIVEQTKTAVKGITKSEKTIPAKFEDAIQEFNDKKANLGAGVEGNFFGNMFGDKKKTLTEKIRALHDVANLKITNLIHPKAVEAAYAELARKKRTGEQLFKNKEVITGSRTKDGDQISIGNNGDYGLVQRVLPGLENAGTIPYRTVEYSKQSLERARELLAKTEKYATVPLAKKAEAEELTAKFMEESRQTRIYENYERLEKEFYRQIETFLEKEYLKHTSTGMSEDEFLGIFAPLLRKLPELALREFPAGHIPFVVVVGENVVGIEKKLKDKQLDFLQLHSKIPDWPAYFLVDIESGKTREGEPLTFEEAVAVLQQVPNFGRGRKIRARGSVYGEEVQYYNAYDHYGNFEEADVVSANIKYYKYKKSYTSQKELQLSVNDSGKLEIYVVETRSDKPTEEGSINCAERIG